jgi:hypothetical protein
MDDQWLLRRRWCRAGGRGCHHGATVPSHEKNWPVGPSSGSIASRTAPAAASPGSPPLAAAQAFMLVAGRRWLSLLKQDEARLQQGQLPREGVPLYFNKRYAKYFLLK